MIREMKEKIKNLENKIKEAMMQKNLSPEQIEQMKKLLTQIKADNGADEVEEEVVEVEDVEMKQKQLEVEEKKI